MYKYRLFMILLTSALVAEKRKSTAELQAESISNLPREISGKNPSTQPERERAPGMGFVRPGNYLPTHE